MTTPAAGNTTDTPRHLRDKYAIVGVGETTYTRGSGRTMRHLATWAPRNALAAAGNLVTPDGALAPPDVVVRVGIGSRVRVVFTDVGEGFSLPQWTLDLDHPQPVPWRYPDA